MPNRWSTGTFELRMGDRGGTTLNRTKYTIPEYVSAEIWMQTDSNCIKNKNVSWKFSHLMKLA